MTMGYFCACCRDSNGLCPVCAPDAYKRDLLIAFASWLARGYGVCDGWEIGRETDNTGDDGTSGLGHESASIAQATELVDAYLAARARRSGKID